MRLVNQPQIQHTDPDCQVRKLYTLRPLLTIFKFATNILRKAAIRCGPHWVVAIWTTFSGTVAMCHWSLLQWLQHQTEGSSKSCSFDSGRKWHLAIILELTELLQKPNFDADHPVCGITYETGDFVAVANRKVMAAILYFNVNRVQKGQRLSLTSARHHALIVHLVYSRYHSFTSYSLVLLSSNTNISPDMYMWSICGHSVQWL